MGSAASTLQIRNIEKINIAKNTRIN